MLYIKDFKRAQKLAKAKGFEAVAIHGGYCEIDETIRGVILCRNSIAYNTWEWAVYDDKVSFYHGHYDQDVEDAKGDYKERVMNSNFIIRIDDEQTIKQVADEERQGAIEVDREVNPDNYA